MTTDEGRGKVVSDYGPCQCDRGPAVVVAFQRNTSLLVRRLGDVGHFAAADLRCIDCVADMAEEVAKSPIRLFHRDFATAARAGIREATTSSEENEA